MKRLSVITLIFMCFLLTACGYENLYSKLDEKQTNEMLALLIRSNIPAKKIFSGDSWSIQVNRENLPHAVEVLKANGYPRDEYQSMGTIFEKEGFVSSPTEERARFLYALSQELSQTVATIDGVVVARVHLAIPEKNSLSEKTEPSSASVFIKHHPDSRISEQISSIKAFIVNSVESLAYDDVTVSLFPAHAMSSDVSPESIAQQPGLVNWFYRQHWAVKTLVTLLPFALIGFLLLHGLRHSKYSPYAPKPESRNVVRMVKGNE